jgi:hypothetical protein
VCAHYEQNPHFVRALALTKQREAAGHTSKVRHTPAHTGNDDAIRALLNAQAVWDQPTKRFLIRHQTVNAIEAIIRRRGSADYIALAQNAMAD